MKDILINDESYFSKESIDKIKQNFKFSQSVHIEMLLWDFEIFAQLSKLLKDLALKGGAATQVYLTSEKQRASRDIDFATLLTKEEIETALQKIHDIFESRKKHNEHFKWSPVLPAKEPLHKIEDLNCYDITVPTIFGKSLGKENCTNLRIDAIRYAEMPFIVKTIEKPFVLGLPFKPFKIISRGSLIADKLLTLADETVGILAIKKEDYESYLKQLYDLNHLIDKFITEAEVLEDIFTTLDKLIPIETKYRKISKSVSDVLKDIILSLNKRMHLDFDHSESAQEFRSSITNFQSNYISKPESVISNEWAARIGKIKFITEYILLVKSGKLNLEQMRNILIKMHKAENKLKSMSGEDIKKSRGELIEHFSGSASFKKQLKNAPIIRVFYGIITTENAEELFRLLEA